MENTKGIYKLNFDCGRQGKLTGIFVAEKEHVRVLIEEQIEVYFGEALGKHSEIWGPMSDGELVLVSDNTEAVKVVEDLKLSTGYNPFHYGSVNFSREGIDTDDLTVQEIIEKLSSTEKT